MKAAGVSSFAETAKRHQIEWMTGNGLPTSMLEVRKGHLSWVLKREHKTRNLYNPSWWRYIEGNEHRWSRSLNSSQCFAVNLFAPIADDTDLAKQVWKRIAPHRPLSDSDDLEVLFEYTPTEAPRWLGERGQPTQVDVAILISSEQRLKGCLLVEVKFTENEFGQCRGAKPPAKGRGGNPVPARCLDMDAVLKAPAKTCWLVEAESRKYWDIISRETSSFDFSALGQQDQPCPFRHGLYQLMRNRVLADAMVQNRLVNWADVAVCVHPNNDAVWKLPDPVAGQRNVLSAINEFLKTPIPSLSPSTIIEAVADAAPTWRDWASKMKGRYAL